MRNKHIILHDSYSETSSATKAGGGGGGGRKEEESREKGLRIQKQGSWEKEEKKGEEETATCQTAPDSPCTPLSRLGNDGGSRSAHVSLQIKVQHMRQLLNWALAPKHMKHSC